MHEVLIVMRPNHPLGRKFNLSTIDHVIIYLLIFNNELLYIFWILFIKYK